MSVAIQTSARKSPKTFKTRKAPNSLNRVFRDDWSDDWVEIADRLCAVLDLPDLTTRGGLKKVHADLDDIHYRLDETFRHARRTGHAKVMGGIVAIYTKMALLDSILQDKIIGIGFFEKMISLTTSPDTIYVALRALNVISHSSSKRTKYEFMRQAPTLLKLLQQHRDDSQAVGLLISIFAHASMSMRTMTTTFDVPAFTTTLLDVLRSPAASKAWLFDHASACLCSFTFDMVNKCKDIKSFTTYRVASLRSKNVLRRIQFMCTLLLSHAGDTISESERAHFCSTEIPSALRTRELPDHLAKIVDAYGQDRCQMFIGRRANVVYTSLFAQHELDSNLLRLGRALATEVQNVQYALPELLCTCCGRSRSCACCSQPWKWPELAFKCAAALRSQSGPSDRLFADILVWKCLTVAREDSNKLNKFLKGALARHPRCALFYYALTSADGLLGDAEALLLSKKGLACPDIIPWVRYALLAKASSSALNCALWEWREPEERCALLVSAYEDSKKYMTEAPPDGIQRQYVLSEHIIITFLVEGPKCSPYTPGIERALKEMQVNQQFMQFSNHLVTDKSDRILTLKTILLIAKEANEEWRGTVQRADEAYLSECEGHPLLETADGASKALSAWYKKFEGTNSGETEDHEDHCGHSLGNGQKASLEGYLTRDKVTIMQCSWCSRPSALLKKCKQCGIVKYCDPECQKADWKEHKLVCASESSVSPPYRQ